MTQPIILQAVITQVGLNAIRNAANSGIDFTIAEVGVGTGQYTPNANRTALDFEQERVAFNRTETIGDEQIDLTFILSSNLAYFVSEVGIYLSDGTLFAVWSDPVNSLTYKPGNMLGDNSLLVTVQLITSALPPDVPINVIVAPLDEALFVTQASEDNMGLVRYAKTGTSEIINSTTTVLSPVQVQLEIQTANTAEQLARDASISDAIAAEVVDRNTAITSAITTEVTDRNNAINTAVTAEASARTTAINDSQLSAGNIVGEIKLLPKLDIKPVNFLLADGSLVLRSAYPDLFNIINHQYQQHVWSTLAYPYANGWDINTIRQLNDNMVAFTTDRNDATQSERLYLSVDNGESFFEPTNYSFPSSNWGRNINCIAFHNQFVGLSENNGAIVGSNDFVDYFRFPSSVTNSANVVYSTVSDKWLVLGSYNNVGKIESFLSTDRFETKTTADVVNTNITLPSITCAIEQNSRLFAFCDNGTTLYIYSSDDGGTTWTERSSEASTKSFNAVAVGDGYIIAVGASGHIRASTDNGITWITQSLPGGTFHINDIVFADSVFYAATTFGNVYSYTPGSSWVNIKNLGSMNLTSLCSVKGKLIVPNIVDNVLEIGVGVYDKNTYFQLPDYEHLGSANLIYTVRAS